MKKGNTMAVMATHVPLLVRAFDASEGDVLEMGTGYFSTLLLRWLCEMTGRNLYSYENNKRWYDRANQKPKPYHKVFFVEDWDDADIGRPWGLAFIDHAPSSRRHEDVKRLKDYADYIVIHDTESQANKIYHYRKIWRFFKYRKDWKKALPFTSVVSNFYDLSKI